MSLIHCSETLGVGGVEVQKHHGFRGSKQVCSRETTWKKESSVIHLKENVVYARASIQLQTRLAVKISAQRSFNDGTYEPKSY
ncbi:hypothetical protein C5167_043909 [Papaver somniferum]|uniref:Uncharacterized protein n=1 Tax=Papaver somniferum TaxID=3469 RepID=A0A4Y7LAM0_PAPSO|nr:hypothetical protein C5167_043909 [Papaver somniferum]